MKIFIYDFLSVYFATRLTNCTAAPTQRPYAMQGVQALWQNCGKERSLAVSTRPHHSHVIRKAKSVWAATFQAIGYWLVRIWLRRV